MNINSKMTYDHSYDNYPNDPEMQIDNVVFPEKKNNIAGDKPGYQQAVESMLQKERWKEKERKERQERQEQIRIELEKPERKKEKPKKRKKKKKIKDIQEINKQKP